METSSLPFLSASDLSRLIQRREVSPVEVTQAYLDRIDQLDDKLHSYITVLRDDALRAARDAEESIARGRSRGLLHGLPIAVKDQLHMKGVRTTAGSKILENFVPDEDATAIVKLKQAGAVFLGKLNLSEFATGDNWYHHFGTPRNPWNLEHSPGVSSSGSGAATAACLCAASLGEDTGGSIRNPAASCGLVGLRPTWGRVSRHGVIGLCWHMDILGPITRTVEDTALLLEAIAGHDPRDRYTSDLPVPDYTKALNGNITGTRVGVIREKMFTDALDPEVRDAVAKAAARLGELGAEVEEVSLPLTVHAGIMFQVICNVEGASLHRRGIREHLNEYDHFVQLTFITGTLMPAQVYATAQKLRELLKQEVLGALRRYDVLLSPTANAPAPRIGPFQRVAGKQQVKDLAYGARNFRTPFNLANVPAVSLPCGFTASKLPIGLQLAGRPFEEAKLLNVAYAYEQSTNWHKMRPPI